MCYSIKMQVPQLIQEARRRLVDVVPAFSFPDDALYLSLDHAQDIRAFKTLCLSGAVDLTVLSGDEAVDLPPEVAQPKRIRYDDEDYELTPGPRPAPRGTYVPPLTFYHEGNQIQAYPTPTEDLEFTLQCYLYPVNLANENTALEVPARYHHALIAGVVYYALQVYDADLYDAQYLKLAEAMWTQALDETNHMAAVHGRTPRPIKYGGL